jgi:hypothetical protein
MPRRNNSKNAATKKSAPAKRRLFDVDVDQQKDDSVQYVNDEKLESTAVTVKTPADTTSSSGRTPTKKLRTVRDFVSPKTLTTSEISKKASIVTPEKVSVEKKGKDDDVADDSSCHVQASSYVPKYIHKNLHYQRKGEASLPSTTKKAYDLIEQHYVIPDDLENNVHQYGPISGQCFEERTIKAYDMGQLKPKEWNIADDGSAVLICSECARTGHTRFDCPELI